MEVGEIDPIATRGKHKGSIYWVLPSLGALVSFLLPILK